MPHVLAKTRDNQAGIAYSFARIMESQAAGRLKPPRVEMRILSEPGMTERNRPPATGVQTGALFSAGDSRDKPTAEAPNLLPPGSRGTTLVNRDLGSLARVWSATEILSILLFRSCAYCPSC